MGRGQREQPGEIDACGSLTSEGLSCLGVVRRDSWARSLARTR